MNKAKFKLMSGLIYSAIIGMVFYAIYSNSQAVTRTVTFSSDNMLGSPTSKVTITEYADYQCPFCIKYQQIIESQLKKDYVESGKVNLKFNNNQFLGAESVAAATAAECAKDQGKFWPYHEALMQAKFQDLQQGGSEGNGFYNRSLFLKLAKDNDLNIATFTVCYDSNKYVNKVQKESDYASEAGINTTPTVFVNNQMVQDPMSYEEIKKLIEKELKK